MERLPEVVIKSSFAVSVWLIEQFYPMTLYEDKVHALRSLEPGTLGKEIAACLDKNHLRLIPGYESHDLKHVLLGYEMTAVDEIRMQAFMIGNGNLSLPSIAIFIYGFILLPYKWTQLYRDFKRGLYAKSIKEWAIDDFAEENTTALRRMVQNTISANC